jgi:hypothetical protein
MQSGVPGSVVVQPKERNRFLYIGVTADTKANPSGVGQNVVRRRAVLLYEARPYSHWEWQVGEPIAVQMPELTATDPELETSETVRAGDDSRPARNLARDPISDALHAVFDVRAGGADPDRAPAVYWKFPPAVVALAVPEW